MFCQALFALSCKGSVRSHDCILSEEVLTGENRVSILANIKYSSYNLNVGIIAYVPEFKPLLN